MTTKRTKAILTLAGVFIGGALCGALVIGTLVRGEVRNSQRLRDRTGLREYFAEQLQLTTAQRDSLQGELDWFYGELAGLRLAAAGDFHELIDSLDRRLAARLSPSQVERLRATETRLRRQLPAPRPLPVEAVRTEEETGDRTTPAPRDTSPLASSRTATPSGATPQDATLRPRGARSTAPDTARVDAGGPDTSDDAMTGLRERLTAQLDLSDLQSREIRQIIVSTRRRIREDVAARRGYPRMQLEVAARHLREMDRRVEALLDDRQRAAYEPIRREMAQRIREKIQKQLKAGQRRRFMGGAGSGDTLR